MKNSYIIAICVGAFIAIIQHIFSKKRRSRKNQMPPTDSMYGKFSVSDTDYMEGTQFEKWCGELLSEIGAKNIRFTKRSGDQGVDIIAEIDGITYAIQCKCYSKPLGNTPVQEVSAGMIYYGCQIGAVMTNNYFTSGGKQLAFATGIQLWDRNWIQRQIDQINALNQIKKKDVKKVKAFVYSESGKGKIEKGLWPHKDASEIDLKYYNSLPDTLCKNSEVIGLPKFPEESPNDLNLDSIITIETNPFDYQPDAELFSRYAEKHFKAKTRIKTKDGKYFVLIQTHVYSIRSNYVEDGYYNL